MASANDGTPVHLHYSTVDTLPVQTVSLTPQPAKTPSRKFGKDISNNAPGRNDKVSSGKKVVRIRRGVTSAKKKKKNTQSSKSSSSNTSSLMEEVDEEEAVSTITYQSQETRGSRGMEGNTSSTEVEYHVQFESGPIGLKLEPVVESTGKEIGCRIVKFVDGGPQRPGQARKSGKIKAGDLLIAIEGIDVSSWEYGDIIARLKWPSQGRRLSFRSVWTEKAQPSSASSSTGMANTETPDTLEDIVSGTGGSSTEEVLSSQILSSFQPDQKARSTNDKTNEEDTLSADLSTVVLSESRESTPSPPQQTQQRSGKVKEKNKAIVATPGRAMSTSKVLKTVVKDVALPVAGVVASSSLSLTASVTSAMSTKLGEVLVGHSNREFHDIVQLKTKLLAELSQAKVALTASQEEQKRLQKEIAEISKEKEAERNAKEKLERELKAAREHQERIEDQIKDMENQIQVLSGSLDEERLQTKTARDDLVSQVEELQRQKQQLEVSFEKEKASLVARESAASDREKNARSQLEETEHELEAKVKEMLTRMEEMDSTFTARNTELESCVQALRDKLQQKIAELDSTKIYVNELLSKQEDLTNQAVEFDSIVQDARREKDEVATELEQVRIELDRARGRFDAVQNQVDETRSTLESTLKEKDIEIENLADELSSRDASVEMLRTMVKEKDTVLHNTMAAVEAARSTEEKLVHKIEELEVIVNEANAEKTFLDDQLRNSQEELSAALNRVSQLEKQLSQINQESESNLNELATKLASTEAALEVAENDLRIKNDRIEELEKLTNEKDDALVAASINFDDLQSKMKDYSVMMANQSEEKIQDEVDKLDMLYSQGLEEMDRILTQKDSQIQSLEEKVISREALIKDTKDDLQSQRTRIEELEKLLNEKEVALAVANKNSDDLRTKVEEVTIAMANENKEKIQNETNKLDIFYLEELDKMNMCMAEKDAQIQNLEQELVSKEAFLEDTENSVLKKSDRIDQLEKLMNEKDEALGFASRKSEDLQTQMEELKITLASQSRETVEDEVNRLHSFYSQEVDKVIDKMKSCLTQKDSHIQNLEQNMKMSKEEITVLNNALQKIKQDHLDELRRFESEKEEALTDLQEFSEEAVSSILNEKEEQICSLKKQLSKATSSDSKLRKRLNDLSKIHSNEISKLERKFAVATREKEDIARANAELERRLNEADSSSEKKEFARISSALREAEDLVSKLHSDFDSEEVSLSDVTDKQSNVSGQAQERSVNEVGGLRSSFLGKQLAQAESRAKDARAEAAQRFKRVKSLEADLEDMSREFELLVKTNELMEERLRSTRSAQLAAEEEVESLEDVLSETKNTQEKLEMKLTHAVSENKSLFQQLEDLKKHVDGVVQAGKDKEEKYEASINKLHESLLESQSKLSVAKITESNLINERNSLKIALDSTALEISKLENKVTEVQALMDQSQSKLEASEKQFAKKLSNMQDELSSVKNDLDSSQNLLAVCEGKRKLVESALQAKETEKVSLERETESQRCRIEKLESSRDEAVSKLTAACEVVDEQKEAVRLSEEKATKSDEIARKHREQTAKMEQRIAELEEAALEQEHTIREEVEKARELLEKESNDASLLVNELEVQLAQAALKIEGVEDENRALCTKIVEWEETCRRAKERESDALDRCALHANEVKKLENKLDERKNETDRLIAHSQVLGSTVTRLRSELLMKETPYKRPPKDTTQHNEESAISTSAEDQQTLSSIVNEEETKRSMRAAGAKMMCRFIEKKTRENEIALLGSSYRHWMCAATTDRAVAYQMQVARAMAQQLETTREKLAVLKTHLKHAHGAERKKSNNLQTSR